MVRAGLEPIDDPDEWGLSADEGERTQTMAGADAAAGVKTIDQTIFDTLLFSSTF